jgi:hypothetical protein
MPISSVIDTRQRAERGARLVRHQNGATFGAVGLEVRQRRLERGKLVGAEHRDVALQTIVDRFRCRLVADRCGDRRGAQQLVQTDVALNKRIGLGHLSKRLEHDVDRLGGEIEQLVVQLSFAENSETAQLYETSKANRQKCKSNNARGRTRK